MTETQKLSRTDRQILRILQREGRITNVDLAERIGMSPSPCLRRLKHLETSGVIAGYSARIDRRAIGLGVEAFVQVSIERHTDVEARVFRQAVESFPEVVACHAMTGAMDFLLRVVVADLDAYGAFAMGKLLKVPGVKDVHSSFVLETLKDSPTLPLDPE
ncbi:MAG: Lrp/AsnC family transcriptional regulator [Rhodobacterales bacterium]|nr:Lrp/AsnC family transcriptional regulator [Rhodobacterales bacterium]